ncbi:phosphoglycolate phosphatase [Alkalilimnicola ehrlichii MLHE-1]|uniref:phosphoglycolate phosphatase n=1 Tax=Alkalilimnicola ehrlichii (strain ATCC BAA-1101 / DSM 17681 / MLHE-1) TaxID=187272 RepID=Q0AA74_ALKEH|nr:phosphoglycolate phosphatase [Alkalilimnicola ehrlichii]ABI56263.1 phosphoglycolate phosphatase [Alkalilimnicola ehrlichii MLHE-1]
MRAARIEGVLFDLDGTLLDTAGDLATALNRVLAEQGRSPLPEARIRPTVSHGAVVMLCHAFALAPDDPAMPALHEAMLRHYEADIAGRTRPFPGMETVLARVEALGLPWGIVTNKPARLTHPLLAALGLDRRAAAVVCGDTAPRPKPHPDPMEAACATLGVAPARCLTAGDALRDIQAGQHAGCPTLAALFGYLGAGDHPAGWGADGLLNTPQDLLRWLPPA